MGIFFAFWRRFFGGYDSKFNFLEYRGVQMILCVLTVFVWEFFKQGKPWQISLFVAVWIYIYWCCGHWPWYTCGTENQDYIDSELARGRKPALNWIVEPIRKWLGFKEWSSEHCFIGLMVRYTIYAIPLIFFVGWKFFAVSFAIPFIYNAMYWVELPKCKIASNATNWAELFSGLIIGWGLV